MCRMPVCRLLRVHSTGRTNSDRREPAEQLLEQHPQLEAGQVRAEAVVHALPEAQVRIRLSRHVEDVRVGERQRVAVRRALPDLHLLPGLDPTSAELHVARRGPALGWRRRGPAHHLLDRRRQQPSRSARSRLHLVRMLDQRQQPACDRVARGLRTGAEQQAEEEVQLEVGHRRTEVVQAFATTDSMSSVGSARLAAINSDAVGVHPRPPSSALAERPEVELRFDRLEQPMPFGLRHSQQDADHLHRQFRGHVDEEVERHARLDRVEQRAASASRRSSSTRPIIRGVRPELTSRRICACRGSSIMLSTWPAIDRSCSSVPPKGRAPPVTDE